MGQLKYLPHVDGLRAFAVIPVILFHMDISWMAGGFLGVDVFFVISGFLITSILVHEMEAGTFSFRKFWARRIRRILPAMMLVSATTLLFARLLLFRGDLPAIAEQATCALLSVANIYFWKSAGDYWGTQAEESPFLHTWSLSVEEQFYLFYPILMWLAFRFTPQWVRQLLLAVIVVSFCTFLWGAVAHPPAAFYLLPPALGNWLSGAISRPPLDRAAGRWHQTHHERWLGCAL